MSTPAATPASQKKRLMDSVFTSTPVIMTIVATLLAGLSSSEMTLAQYHRSLAAQNQSKAGDQWNFFQAKRIRGTNMATTVDLLRGLSESGSISAAELESALAGIQAWLEQCQKDADQLAQTIAVPGGAPSEAAAARLAQLRETLKKRIAEGTKLKAQMSQALADAEVKAALPYLQGQELPTVEDQPFANDKIKEALAAIAARKTESETREMIAALEETAIKDALNVAEDNAQAFDKAAKPAGKVLDRIGKVVTDRVAGAREVVRAVRELELALGQGKSTLKVDTAASMAALAASTRSLKTRADDLNNDFTAARLDYTNRRYEKEARYNQTSAELYEVQVRKSGITSERHRTRSKNFFYGMLAAQAGVTIASLSLAVRRKSVLWSLAGLAGLGAVIFGGYVYLYM
jgi:hypothetical protein